MLKGDIEKAIAEKTDIISCAQRAENADGAKSVVVGESVYAGSLARAVRMQTGRPVRVIHTLDTDDELVADEDKRLADEDKLEEEFSQCECVYADPLFKPIVSNEAEFTAIPHEAFSGRCFRKSIKNFVDRELEF